MSQRLNRVRRDSASDSRPVRLIALALVVAFSACSDDGDPSGPGDGPPVATRLVVEAPASATEGSGWPSAPDAPTSQEWS